MEIEKNYPFSPYTLYIKIGEVEAQQITDEFRGMVGTTPNLAVRYPYIFNLLDSLRQQAGYEPFPAC